MGTVVTTLFVFFIFFGAALREIILGSADTLLIHVIVCGIVFGGIIIAIGIVPIVGFVPAISIIPIISVVPLPGVIVIVHVCKDICAVFIENAAAFIWECFIVNHSFLIIAVRVIRVRCHIVLDESSIVRIVAII